MEVTAEAEALSERMGRVPCHTVLWLAVRFLAFLTFARWLKLANGERDRYEYLIFTETLCCLGVKIAGNCHAGISW